MNWIFCNVISLLCVGFAMIGAIHNMDGWGWFLAIGAGLAIAPSFSTGDEEDDEEENTSESAPEHKD